MPKTRFVFSALHVDPSVEISRSAIGDHIKPRSHLTAFYQIYGPLQLITIEKSCQQPELGF